MKIVNVFCFLMFVGVITNGQPSNSGKDVKGPKITFQTTSIDYGIIEKDADPVRVFHFTNTGDMPLIITDAKGSCGCTVPTYPNDAIAPGKSASIEVRYDTKRVGNFTKMITVISNAGDPVSLKITGEVKAAM